MLHQALVKKKINVEKKRKLSGINIIAVNRISKEAGRWAPGSSEGRNLEPRDGSEPPVVKLTLHCAVSIQSLPVFMKNSGVMRWKEP